MTQGGKKSTTDLHPPHIKLYSGFLHEAGMKVKTLFSLGRQKCLVSGSKPCLVFNVSLQLTNILK